MFKCQEHMTDSQQQITDEFMGMIEDEYALCVREMNRANQAAYTTDSEDSVGVNCACGEIDAIREYWYKRLLNLIETISWRNPKLVESLANKYLKNE